jgi:hypothetical protein
MAVLKIDECSYSGSYLQAKTHEALCPLLLTKLLSIDLRQANLDSIALPYFKMFVYSPKKVKTVYYCYCLMKQQGDYVFKLKDQVICMTQLIKLKMPSRAAEKKTPFLIEVILLTEVRGNSR